MPHACSNGTAYDMIVICTATSQRHISAWEQYWATLRRLPGNIVGVLEVRVDVTVLGAIVGAVWGQCCWQGRLVQFHGVWMVYGWRVCRCDGVMAGRGGLMCCSGAAAVWRRFWR